VLRMLGEERKLELTGSIARIPAHVSTANPVDDKMWRSVEPVLEKAGFGGMTLTELAAAAAIREPQLKDFLHRKAKTGAVVPVTQQRFYLRGTLAQFAAIADGVFRTVPGGKFSAAQVRDQTDIGRGRAIEILECFDRLGITQRVGDLRVMRKDYTAILSPATLP
jgi:selenocysteine-specific elongation factor